MTHTTSRQDTARHGKTRQDTARRGAAKAKHEHGTARQRRSTGTAKAWQRHGIGAARQKAQQRHDTTSTSIHYLLAQAFLLSIANFPELATFCASRSLSFGLKGFAWFLTFRFERHVRGETRRAYCWFGPESNSDWSRVPVGFLDCFKAWESKRLCRTALSRRGGAVWKSVH